MASPVTGILQRALTNLQSAWRVISQSSRAVSAPRLRADLPEEDALALRGQMLECLEGRGGEVSARARAAALGRAYLDLNDHGRKRFLQVLANDFGVDWPALHAAIRDIREDTDAVGLLDAEQRLREILTPPRVELLTRFNSLPSGVKFLVDMRADLRRFVEMDPALRSLDHELKRLLTSWFDVGFLNLERITWDSPAALLERLIAYEAVHEIQSWDDLKNRLGEDRRCYAFFHPRMPDEPLIFVEVALASGMSDSIQTLLDETSVPRDPATANTAVFYSISNTQRGLQGVNLGTFLIKRVLDRLVSELPGLKVFATLSPIPDFGRYLRATLRRETGLEWVGPERESVESALGGRSIADVLEAGTWRREPELVRALKRPLMRLCVRYLLLERDHGHAIDRVANFHLSNGARVERINWLADVSDRGMERSAGMMVNYRYELDKIEENHEAYRATGEAAASAAIKSLVIERSESG